MAKLKLFDKRTAQVLLTTLAFAVSLLFLYAAWRVIIAFLFAVFFAYLLEAPVARLQSWLRGSRIAAITVVYLMFLIGMVLIFVLAGPSVLQEAQKLTQQVPGWAQEVSSGQIVNQVGASHGWSQNTVDTVRNWLMEHREEVLNTTQTLVLRTAKTIQSLWWLILVPILAIFFLKDGHQFGEIIVNAAQNQNSRRVVAATVEQMNSMLGHFIRAQLMLSALAVVVITFVIWAVGVNYAFAVGPAAGALEFIPVVGPVVGGAMVLGVAFFSGYNHVFWLFVFLLIWRCIQDYVSSPRIMGSKLELHPLAVLFGVLAGGEVAGVIGVFLSIPVLATIRILWHTWRLYRSSISMEAESTAGN
ncbi:MAG TPA: AI-2E family transporter [Candidatus Angelobacter sp.]|nr:AI-2E family transporter [Candidatus Angelobacter sp.]